MNNPFKISPLSKESLRLKLEAIDRALAKLDSSQSSYVAASFTKDDLYDTFLEARRWVCAQLDVIEDLETGVTDEGYSSDPLAHTYQIEATRNKVGRSL